MLACHRRASFQYVPEYGSEITDDVDYEEDGAFTTMHREIAPSFVASDRMGLPHGYQYIVHSTGRAQNVASCISGKRENEDNNQYDDRVDVVSQEGSPITLLLPYSNKWAGNLT